MCCTGRARALSRRLIAVRDEERRLIAQELHDRFAQNLVALEVNLTFVRAALPTDAIALVGDRLNDCLNLIQQTEEITSEVISELRTPPVDQQALVVNLRKLAVAFSSRTGVPATVIGTEPSSCLTSNVRTALYRIALEAFTNIAKHARCSKATVSFEETNDVVRMIISDDGRGFPTPATSPCTAHRGLGLLTMRERAEAVGGLFRIETVVGRGTIVTVEVRKQADEHHCISGR